MNYYTLKHEQVLSMLPERKPDGHKGSFGKILLLCGSRGYTGAAALASMGALRSGAGLVYLGVPESIYSIEAIKLTEPIVFPLPEDDGKLSERAVNDILNFLPRMDAVLIGPGLGQSLGTMAVLEAVLNNGDCPVVIDADGINLIAKHKDILRGRKGQTVLTPHMGEFMRLSDRADCDRMVSAVETALDLQSIIVLKGHDTVITDGHTVFINPTGNPGMAVGGSGDVLAGMITALIGQGLPPLEASACAAWIHGAAGDICASFIGQYGMLPSDMLREIPRLMK